MWETKTFKTRKAMLAWIERNDEKYQWHEIFVCNGYGVEYRPPRIIIEFGD